jgi:hypothetical protein
MKRSTLQQHKEAMILCEEGMITVEARNDFQYRTIPNMQQH